MEFGACRSSWHFVIQDLYRISHQVGRTFVILQLLILVLRYLFCRERVSDWATCPRCCINWVARLRGQFVTQWHKTRVRIVYYVTES